MLLNTRHSRLRFPFIVLLFTLLVLLPFIIFSLDRRRGVDFEETV